MPKKKSDDEPNAPPTKEMEQKEKATEDKTPQDIDEAVKGTTEVKKLEDLHGIGPKTAEKLRELGYSVVGLATARADEVAAEMKVNYAIAKQWCSEAQEAVLAKMTMVNVKDYDDKKKATQMFFKTGAKNFNTIVGGGIPTQSITGLSGRFASGKTEIAYDVSIDCLLQGYEVVYIETEPDTVHLDRFKEMAREKKVNPDWSKLYICPAEQIPTAKAQYLQYRVVQKALEKNRPIKLVVVDSFNAKFRAGYSRSEMLPIRTREFAEHFVLMEYIAATYNVAWLLTCQTIAPPRPDQGLAARMKFGDQFYPVGGDLVLHSVNNWIALEQIKTELWKATLYDSSHLPRESATFMITSKGLQDEIA